MLGAPLIPDSSFNNVLIVHNSRDLADSSMSFHSFAALCCTCTNPEYKPWSVNHILFCYMCKVVWQITCARTKSPTLGKGSPPWVTNWELSFIISVNSSSARMISSTFSFRPATVIIQQMLPSRFLQYLTGLVLNGLSFLKQPPTWAGEDIGEKHRVSIDIDGLVFKAKGLFLQESILTGQTKHWVLLRRSMDPICTNLDNTITCKSNSHF